MAIINGCSGGIPQVNKIQADCEKLSAESKEIKASKDMLAECFASFCDSEDYMQNNWEGDTANYFKKYRERMDEEISKAMNVSEKLAELAAEFARTSKQIDEEAEQIAKGLK